MCLENAKQNNGSSFKLTNFLTIFYYNAKLIVICYDASIFK